MAHGLISSKNTNKNKKIDKVKRSLTLRCLCQYCDPRYDWAGQCSEFRLSGLSASHVIIYCGIYHTTKTIPKGYGCFSQINKTNPSWEITCGQKLKIKDQFQDLFKLFTLGNFQRLKLLSHFENKIFTMGYYLWSQFEN